ncbi:hypothetical protein [Halalkalibacter akibai]|uniref:Uncharacterized protein n=1 Tax=Halalkalibacter akibai (strain ATCC 43226 / DSM 21942 / CIP 109018 / JCM 9157 / 1139) TaxID=1236973 RepID=W4QU48_HALA3|nr:hypothetical protein [Halalkalibacter akibai]GAE35695.1 hypothetical protein JCM9157_2812 [Halalkalibacter akibai JCM 9157]
MLEIYLINSLDSPFNKKDNMFYRKGYSVEYETEHLENLMYSVEEEDVLNPAEELAKFIKSPTEEVILFYFYNNLANSTKAIIGEPMIYGEFKGSKLERTLETILKKWAGTNYEIHKSYFAKYLHDGPDSYDDLDNVFIISTQHDEKFDELIEVINSLHI